VTSDVVVVVVGGASTRRASSCRSLVAAFPAAVNISYVTAVRRGNVTLSHPAHVHTAADNLLYRFRRHRDLYVTFTLLI